MGSGDRVNACRTNSFGLGVYVGRFPFAITVGLHFLLWHVTVGFGKGYDK